MRRDDPGNCAGDTAFICNIGALGSEQMLSPFYLVALALAASGVSILSVILVSYEIYSDLNLLATNIEEELREFKVVR